jgi:hypothetical protein
MAIGEERGMAIGEEHRAKEIGRNLIKMGFSPEDVLNATGLDADAVQGLFRESEKDLG